MTRTRRRASLDLFGPVRTGRAVDAVVEQIVDLINAGRLEVDELLPGERGLAAAMDVSRGTIRDAVEQLSQAKVVAVSPGPSGGIQVVSIWVPDALTLDQTPIAADRVFELLEARRVIEMRVAQLAGLRGTDGDFRIMAETIQLQRENAHDGERLSKANARFHRQLWRAGANEELELSMRSIYRRLGGAFETALQRDVDAHDAGVGIDLHDETLDAIRRGDSEQIALVMDRHLAYLETRCEAVHGRARIRQVPAFLIGAGD